MEEQLSQKCVSQNAFGQPHIEDIKDAEVEQASEGKQSHFFSMKGKRPKSDQNNPLIPPQQFKILQTQQNQSLGDQSFSLQKFPSYSMISNIVHDFKKKSIDISTEIHEKNKTPYKEMNLGGEHTNESFSKYNDGSNIYDTQHNQSNFIDDEVLKLELTKIGNQENVDTLQKRTLKNIMGQQLTPKANCIDRISMNSPSRMSVRKKRKQAQENSPDQFQFLQNSQDEDSKTIENKGVRRKRKNNFQILDQFTAKQIWKKKWMTITNYISKMKRIALQSSLFFRPQQLRELQVRLINDVSSDQKSHQRISSFTKYNLGRTFSYSKFQHFISFRNYRKIVKSIIKYFGCLIDYSKKMRVSSYNLLRTILNKFPLFHNLSTLYILWEAVIFIASSILFLYLPFEYCFNITRNVFFVNYIQIICPIIFGFDIFIKMNTKSSESGSFIEQHLEIFFNYLNSNLLTDFISVLSLNIQIFGFQGTYFLFFLRIFQSFRILEIIREQFLLRMNMFGIISLFYLLAQILYFGHLFTCLWNYVGLKELTYNDGWMRYYHFDDISISGRYIQIFYYATVTMTTIGYGDFTAQSELEKLLMIFIAFFSCGIFGYTINSIGNILYDFKQRRDKYLQELAKINMYFKQYNVDLGLQGRARKYLQCLYRGDKNDNVCSIKSLSTLSEYLQKEIQSDVYIKKLQKIQVFKEILTDEILSELALLMKEMFYSPDQQINPDENENEPQLYFVNTGVVLEYCQYDSNTDIKEISVNSFIFQRNYTSLNTLQLNLLNQTIVWLLLYIREKVIKKGVLTNNMLELQINLFLFQQHIREGQHFGLLKFLQGDLSKRVKYKSVGISSILLIGYNSFISVLQKYDEAFQKFSYLKDEVTFSQNLIKIHAHCTSCLQRNHQLEDCPYLFYEGKKALIMRKYFKDIENTIKQFKRKQVSKSVNALSGNPQVIETAFQYYHENSEYFSMWDISQGSEEEDENYLEEENDECNEIKEDLKENNESDKSQNENMKEKDREKSIYENFQDNKFSICNFNDSQKNINDTNSQEKDDINYGMLQSFQRQSKSISGVSVRLQQFLEDEAVEESQYPLNQRKMNQKSKRIKASEISINTNTLSLIPQSQQEHDHSAISPISISKSILKRMETQQSQYSQISNINSGQTHSIRVQSFLKNLESYLSSQCHKPSHCQIQNCSLCIQMIEIVDTLMKKIMKSENYRPLSSIRVSALEPSKKKSSLFCIREKTDSIRKSISNMNSQNQFVSFKFPTNGRQNMTSIKVIDKSNKQHVMENLSNTNELFYYYEFQKLINYQYYYPEWNYEVVIAQIRYIRTIKEL